MQATSDLQLCFPCNLIYSGLGRKLGLLSSSIEDSVLHGKGSIWPLIASSRGEFTVSARGERCLIILSIELKCAWSLVFERRKSKGEDLLDCLRRPLLWGNNHYVALPKPP
jgi:hypothetical protein